MFGTTTRLFAKTLQRSAPQLRSFSSSAKALPKRTTALALLSGSALAASAVGASVAFSAPSTDYNKVREAIASILDIEDYDDGSLGPVLVRLAWHSSGTYSIHDKTGGAVGATMRFSPEADHGANAGLHIARAALEPIKEMFPGCSYADLYTLAGVVAIEEMGGPKIDWTPGRKDDNDNKNCTPDGRLPDAAQGAQHLRDIFYRMGFDDKDIVALSGAHSMGRCHTDRSGFKGPWTRAPTTVSNLYYQEVLNNTWTVKKWNGPLQYEDPTGDLMMLPTDLAIRDDPEFRKYAKVYAEDEDKWRQDFARVVSKLFAFGHNPESWAPKIVVGTLVALGLRS